MALCGSERLAWCCLLERVCFVAINGPTVQGKRYARGRRTQALALSPSRASSGWQCDLCWVLLSRGSSVLSCRACTTTGHARLCCLVDGSSSSCGVLRTMVGILGSGLHVCYACCCCWVGCGSDLGLGYSRECRSAWRALLLNGLKGVVGHVPSLLVAV
jgi:hypothetical protein